MGENKTAPWEESAGREFMKTVPTCELVEELKHREGVEVHIAGPCAKLILNVDGPAVVMSVID